jgi:hypothetical protein
MDEILDAEYKVVEHQIAPPLDPSLDPRMENNNLENHSPGAFGFRWSRGNALSLRVPHHREHHIERREILISRAGSDHRPEAKRRAVGSS